jgi:nucleoside diphosphate kinase
MDEISSYFVWSFKGIVAKIASKSPKSEIKFYASKVAQKLAKKVVIIYNNKYGKKFTQEQIEAMFNDVFDYLIEKGVDS